MDQARHGGTVHGASRSRTGTASRAGPPSRAGDEGTGSGGQWRIPRCWPGATVVCIASGPSLSDGQLEHVRRAHEAGACRVIVINSTWQRVPTADALYGADAQWWRDAHNCPGFKGLKICGQAIEFRDVRYVRADHQIDGLSEDPCAIAGGGNSGYQAVNVAVLMGATRILLLGYDMKFGPNGEKHHHPDHARRNPVPNQLQRWAETFRAMRPDLKRLGIEVLNCTPGSAIDAFPRAKIEDVL